MSVYEVEVRAPDAAAVRALREFARSHDVDLEAARSADGVKVLTLVVENRPEVLNPLTALIASLRESRPRIRRDGEPVRAEDLRPDGG